jgi:hypothetical protein
MDGKILADRLNGKERKARCGQMGGLAIFSTAMKPQFPLLNGMFYHF